MKVDPSRFIAGDEWHTGSPTTLRPNASASWPSSRRRYSARVESRFLDDPDERVEKVPGSRLRVPWNEVGSFDALMANWQRINDLTLDDVEEACAEEVFLLLIGRDVAELQWSPVSGATDIYDRTRLAEIVGGSINDILTSAEWFDHDGRTVLSPSGTLLLAEAACRAHPNQVLDLVIEKEAESRHKCKFGGAHRIGHDSRSTSPEWEYDWYRRYDRPRHELLRQWCGHRAVTPHERFLAAEAETHRLDILVTDLLKALDSLGAHDQAARFAEEHERERITPHTIRPVVERPCTPPKCRYARSRSDAAGGELPLRDGSLSCPCAEQSTSLAGCRPG